MAMQISLIIDADGNAAIATVDKLGTSVAKTGAASEKMGKQSRKAGTDTKALGNSATAAKTKVDVLSAAEARNAAAAQAMAKSNKVAAGNMGNLVAQFNDVGVMMAAGQNPLTLALQQGTQISQVIGPMGAAGAVSALGGALKGMLNPISLVTIGTIAGAAAFTQWASGAISAGKETRTFDDILEDLNTSVSDYKSLAKQANSETADLASRFGTAGVEASGVLGYLAEFARIEAVQEVDAAVEALTERFGGLSRSALKVTSSGTIKEIDNTFFELRDELQLTDRQAATVVMSLERLANAKTLNSKVAAANDLHQAFLRVFGTVDQIPTALLTVAKEAGLIAIQAGEIAGEYNKINAAFERQGFMLREGNLARGEATAKAKELLGDMMAQNTILAATNLYGAESVEVARLRERAERDAFEELVASKDISQDLKDRLMGAFLVAQDLANADIGLGIRGANSDAFELANTLGIAANAALSIQNKQSAKSKYGGRGDGMAEWRRRADPNAPDPNKGRFVYTGPRLDQNNNPIAKRGSGTDKRELDRQREAVERLEKSLEDELAVMRESDPIQKEMLRNRETLAAASAAEREQIEELITTRNAETDALELQQERWDLVRSVGMDAFDSLRESGGNFNDMLGTIAERLEDLVWQAMLLGEGPLASIFGTAEDGGILGTIASAIVPAPTDAASLGGLPGKASGGKIYGPGSGTSDDVLMWGSNGEFMMTAKATQAYQPILEMMNAGSFPKYAQGGIIGSAPTSQSIGNSMQNQLVDVRISMDRKGNLIPIIEYVSEGVAARAFDSFDQQMPSRVHEISNDRWKV